MARIRTMMEIMLGAGRIRRWTSDARVRVAVCLGVVFLAEVGVMAALRALLSDRGGLAAHLTDAALLTVLVGPVLAWAVMATGRGGEVAGPAVGGGPPPTDRRVRSTAWLALGCVGALSCATMAALMSYMSDAAHDPATVNEVGWQRTLAARLSEAAGRVLEGRPIDRGATARDVTALDACGGAVRSAGGALEDPGDAVTEMLASRESMLGAARDMLDADGTVAKGGATRVLRESPRMVRAAGDLLRAFDDDAHRDMHRLRVTAAALLALKLGVLAAFGLAGIEPAARELRRRVAEVERLAMVAERTDNGVVITDAAGVIEWCNEGFTRISGYTLDEVRGRRPGDLLQGPGTDAGTVAQMREAVREGRAFRVQVQNYSKSGAPYWVSIDTQPLRDGAGRLTGFMAIESDVTGRVELEGQLRTERERLRVACESVGAGVWDFDPATGRLIWDAAMHRIFGVDPAGELSYSVWRSSVLEADLEETEARLQEALLGGRPFHTTFRIRLPGGEVRWISADATVVRDGRGRPVHVIGVNIDVTERVLAERREREFGERLRRITAEVSGVVHQFAMRPDGRFCLPYASEAIRQVYRLSPEDVRHDATRLFEVIHPDDVGGVRDSIARSAKTMSRWSHDYRVRFPDGEVRWLHGDSVPQREPDGTIVWTGFVTDVTDRVLASEQLARARDEAEAANRAKSAFLANMSHEIRTPMAAICGYADLLGEAPDRASLAEYAATIKRNGEHLLAVVNDILDLSKIEAGRLALEPGPVGVATVVDEVVALLAVQAAGKGIVLEREFETPVPERVVTDAVRLRQVLMNLVGNAVKFTELGGVRLLVGYDAHGPSGPLLRFTVADTGVGIQPGALARLFRPFEQGSSGMTRRYGGTGLGLSISKRLAQMLGGDITAESEAGRGSAFTLTVAAPAAPGAATVDVAHAGPAPVETPGFEPPGCGAAAMLGGVRVLLAEDGPDNRRLLAHLLRKAGAEVETAENGRVALDRALDLSRPGFDLIVMDMQMPELDGYTATRALRGRGVDLPVLALTAHAMAGDRDACLAAGCDDYATKPIHGVALVEACRRAMLRRGRDPAAAPAPAAGG